MCFGREATILAPLRAIRSRRGVGTTASDVIHALAGDDNVYAVALDADPNQEVGDD